LEKEIHATAYSIGTQRVNCAKRQTDNDLWSNLWGTISKTCSRYDSSLASSHLTKMALETTSIRIAESLWLETFSNSNDYSMHNKHKIRIKLLVYPNNQRSMENSSI
jgi:hypothetical protein